MIKFVKRIVEFIYIKVIVDRIFYSK